MLNSPVYWETIITDPWFLKLTVSKDTSIKIPASIKWLPPQ